MPERREDNPSRSGPFEWIRILYWPLSGLCAGVLFWVLGSGDPTAVYRGWARGWPWFVVGWGLFLGGVRLAGGSRLRLTGYDAAWLLLWVFTGTGLTAMTHLTPGYLPVGSGFALDRNLFDLLGENFELQDAREWPVPPGALVEIRNGYGSVNVRPSADDRLRLVVEKTVRAGSVDEARVLGEEVSFDLVGDEKRLILGSNLEEMNPEVERRYRIRLEVGVPYSSPVTVENGRGTVYLEGLREAQTVYTRDGDILIRPEGGTLEAHGLRGNIRIVFMQPPQGFVALSADQGSLRVELPFSSDIAVRGWIREGILRSSLPGVTSRPDDDVILVEGFGEAPTAEIEFAVTHGQVEFVDRGWWALGR